MSRRVHLAIACFVVLAPGAAIAQTDIPLRPGVPIPTPPTPPPMVRISGVDELPPLPTRLPVFYPPVPPALGAAVERILPLYTPTWDAPAELAAYINEPFYALLGTQLAERALSRKHEQRLREFRARRDEARATLRARLQGAAGPAAATPTPAAIEAEADALRSLLYNEELDWNRHRGWELQSGAAPIMAAITRLREFQVLRAAVFSAEGLSAAQRRLLLELTFEMGGMRRVAELAPLVAKPGVTIFFQPETSRFALPGKLPEVVLRDLNAFLQAKHQVRREIADEVMRTDALTERQRKRALTELAQRHGPLIDGLEERAEALRLALAPHRPPPPSSTLPAAVVKLAADYRAQRQIMQDELATRLKAARREMLSYEPELERMRWTNPMPNGGYVSAPSIIADLYNGQSIDPPAWLAETQQQESRPATARVRLAKVTDAYAKESADKNAALQQRRTALLVATARALGLVETPADDIPPEKMPEIAAALHELLHGT